MLFYSGGKYQILRLDNVSVNLLFSKQHGLIIPWFNRFLINYSGATLKSVKMPFFLPTIL
jgi:hypothetical protein